MTAAQTLHPQYLDAADAVLEEIAKARARFGPMHGPHEGYAVLLEEVDELWEEIVNNKRPASEYGQAIYDEAIQVAAMGICIMVEVAERIAAQSFLRERS